MSSILQIQFMCKPLSVNHTHGRSRFGGVYLKKEAKAFKSMIAGLINSKFAFNEKTHFISIEYYFYLSNFYTKTGTINKKATDIDNMVKLTNDAVFEKLGINDCFVCDLQLKKRYGIEDKTVIIIRAERREALATEKLTA